MSASSVLLEDVAQETSDPVGAPEQGVPLVVRSFGATDLGQVRTNNEDHFLIAALHKALKVRQTSMPMPRIQFGSDQSHLFIVADGMGGHAGGEQASALTINSVYSFVLETFKWFAQFKSQLQDDLVADFQRAVAQANARVLAEAEENPKWHGMGTTLTLAYTLNDELFVAHVGDSRCYLFRSDRLHRLTRDHTLVDELVRHGAVPPEKAAKHHLRHVITNAVGGEEANVKVEVHKVHLESGDILLLCSDGLSNLVSDTDITRVLQKQADPEQACQQLVAQANANGGTDNITVIVARFAAAA